MEEFKKYYKFPLFFDGHEYVWTFDNHMALQKMVDSEVASTMVDILNGKSNKHCNAEYIDGFIVVDGVKCFLVRGWGMLTSVGGYLLNVNKAAEMQDAFAMWCVNKLNGSI